MNFSELPVGALFAFVDEIRANDEFDLYYKHDVDVGYRFPACAPEEKFKTVTASTKVCWLHHSKFIQD